MPQIVAPRSCRCGLIRELPLQHKPPIRRRISARSSGLGYPPDVHRALPVLFALALLGCDPYAGYRSPHGEDCVTHGDFDRCWDSHVPASGVSGAPLVVDMHGWTGRPDNQRRNSGLEALADAEGFAVAWPYGLGRSWNAGPGCCNPAAKDGVDDVGFLRTLVAHVVSQHDLDADRVYVTGLSNGCAMTQRFAVEASDLVAAAACMSMVLLVDAPADYAPVPLMELHGTNDQVVPYDGDDFPGAQANLETLRTLNGCTGEAAITWSEGEHQAETWQTCDGGTEVSLVTIDGGGHVLYAGQGTPVDTSRLAWDFMSRFSK